MTKYLCKECAYSTNHKSKYERHLLSTKHKHVYVDIFECKYCGKHFKHRQNMHRHVKYVCKENDNEDTMELVRLLNIQQNENKKTFKNMKKQINKLSTKLQINNQINCNNNIHNHITLLSYEKTDISHLTNSDYIISINKVNNCVPSLMEKIHYNPSKPENMNIYVPNIKNKNLMVYENGTWNLKTLDDRMGKIFNDKYLLLCDWIKECNNKKIINKFDRFEKNLDNEEVLADIKSNLFMMMYNQKDNVKKLK
jgi:hypothetical protein